MNKTCDICSKNPPIEAEVVVTADGQPTGVRFLTKDTIDYDNICRDCLRRFKKMLEDYQPKAKE